MGKKAKIVIEGSTEIEIDDLLRLDEGSNLPAKVRIYVVVDNERIFVGQTCSIVIKEVDREETARVAAWLIEEEDEEAEK